MKLGCEMPLERFFVGRAKAREGFLFQCSCSAWCVQKDSGSWIEWAWTSSCRCGVCGAIWERRPQMSEVQDVTFRTSSTWTPYTTVVEHRRKSSRGSLCRAERIFNIDDLLGLKDRRASCPASSYMLQRVQKIIVAWS